MNHLARTISVAPMMDWSDGHVLNFRPDHDLAYVVVEVGGGTTDISIIERTFSKVDWDFVFEIGCVAGDNRLGGIDFDAALSELILSKRC